MVTSPRTYYPLVRLLSVTYTRWCLIPRCYGFPYVIYPAVAPAHTLFTTLPPAFTVYVYTTRLHTAHTRDTPTVIRFDRYTPALTPLHTVYTTATYRFRLPGTDTGSDSSFCIYGRAIAYGVRDVLPFDLLPYIPIPIQLLHDADYIRVVVVLFTSRYGDAFPAIVVHSFTLPLLLRCCAFPVPVGIYYTFQYIELRCYPPRYSDARIAICSDVIPHLRFDLVGINLTLFPVVTFPFPIGDSDAI